MEWILELHIEIIKYWNGFVGIVAWWLIWLAVEEMKFGMEFYIHYTRHQIVNVSEIRVPRIRMFAVSHFRQVSQKWRHTY